MPDDWGGIERYVATLAKAQSAAGHFVRVVAPRGSPLASKCGVETVPIDIRESMRALLAYMRHFTRHKYDVVVTHFSPDYRLPALASRLSRGGPVLMTRHLVEPFRADRAAMYRPLYRGYVGVSKAVGEALAESFPRHQIRSVWGGCEPLHLKPGPRIDGKLRVGFFGRIVAQKGVDLLVQARSRATRDWSVQVYGDGPDLPELREAAVGLDVTFHGKVEDVSAAMSGVDVVALPSRWAEAFSIAALEALSLGKPIVASRVGGLPELFEANAPGKLFEDSNVQQLGCILDDYAQDVELVAHDGSIGKALYDTMYTPAHMAERLTAAYRELIA
jgi:glycosyltransferase involved in cell wall biosynthesis